MPRTWPSVNWWRIAWLPSRSVESVIRIFCGVDVRHSAPPALLVAAAVRWTANFSPMRAAAAVMMSRLPE